MISTPDLPLTPVDRRAADVEAQLAAEVDAVVSRASRAQEAFENWNDDRIDALLHDLAAAFSGAAEDLARATVAETGMGSVADKTVKPTASTRPVGAFAASCSASLRRPSPRRSASSGRTPCAS